MSSPVRSKRQDQDKHDDANENNNANHTGRIPDMALQDLGVITQQLSKPSTLGALNDRQREGDRIGEWGRFHRASALVRAVFERWHVNVLRRKERRLLHMLKRQKKQKRDGVHHHADAGMSCIDIKNHHRYSENSSSSLTSPINTVISETELIGSQNNEAITHHQSQNSTAQPQFLFDSRSSETDVQNEQINTSGTNQRQHSYQTTETTQINNNNEAEQFFQTQNCNSVLTTIPSDSRLEDIQHKKPQDTIRNICAPSPTTNEVVNQSGGAEFTGAGNGNISIDGDNEYVIMSTGNKPYDSSRRRNARLEDLRDLDCTALGQPDDAHVHETYDQGISISQDMDRRNAHAGTDEMGNLNCTTLTQNDGTHIYETQGQGNKTAQGISKRNEHINEMENLNCDSQTPTCGTHAHETYEQGTGLLEGIRKHNNEHINTTEYLNKANQTETRSIYTNETHTQRNNFSQDKVRPNDHYNKILDCITARQTQVNGTRGQGANQSQGKSRKNKHINEIEELDRTSETHTHDGAYKYEVFKHGTVFSSEGTMRMEEIRELERFDMSGRASAMAYRFYTDTLTQRVFRNWLRQVQQQTLIQACTATIHTKIVLHNANVLQRLFAEWKKHTARRKDLRRTGLMMDVWVTYTRQRQLRRCFNMQADKFRRYHTLKSLWTRWFGSVPALRISAGLRS